MNTEILVPLNRLRLSPNNVRKSSSVVVDDLAAMIYSQGLLHRLGVVPRAKGKSGDFDVVAGGRRLAALRLLVAQGKLVDEQPIECLQVPAEQAVEISLAENIGRVDMHPADQFIAFKKLVDSGKSIVDVAAAFGVSELTVSRRLKLASVSPRLFSLYRKGDMTLEQLMQFTLTDDHTRQERVWKDAPGWQREPHQLRKLLLDADIATSDPLAVFVGVDVYRKAGGELRPDLFSDDGLAFITNSAVLRGLATNKLEGVAAKHREDGWLWVETCLRYDYNEMANFRRMTQGYREPTAKERPKLDALKSQLEALESQNMDELDEQEQETLCEDIDNANHALEDFMASLVLWTPEHKAVAGVIVTVDEQGRTKVMEGLVRPDDEKRLNRLDSPKDGAASPSKPAHSDSLTRALTAHRTAAIQAALLKRPTLALVVLAHRLVLQTFDQYIGNRIDDPLCLKSDTSGHVLQQNAGDIEQSRAWGEMAATQETWASDLPADPKQLFAWLVQWSERDLVKLLTYCVAASINAVAHDGNHHIGNALASALELDMAEWWTPTAAGYLKNVSKAQILAAVSMAKSVEAANAMAKLKKPELIAAAESALVGTRWLPDLLKAAV